MFNTERYIALASELYIVLPIVKNSVCITLGASMSGYKMNQINISSLSLHYALSFESEFKSRTYTNLSYIGQAVDPDTSVRYKIAQFRTMISDPQIFLSKSKCSD